jgi:hypothetical protein
MLRPRTSFTLSAVAGLLLVTILFTSVAAQQDYVLQVEGRVVWISGQTMFLAPDGAPGFTIDVTRISQSELRELNTNEYVVVTGVFLRPGRRLAATSIQRVSPWYPQAP